MIKRTEINIVEERDHYARRKNYIASHPSFGFMSASVINCSKPHKFVSSRAAYDKYIALSFQTCNLAFDQYHSHETDHRTFSKLSIAPHDFVRFLSSVYTGDYINVELSNQLNTDTVINVDAIKSEIDFENLFKESLVLAWDNTLNQINEYLNKIEDHINDVHKLSAKELKGVKNSLYHAVKNMTANADYGLDVWDEYFDKLENEVLIEVDGLLVNQSINQSVSSQTSTENIINAIGHKG
jgi:hypothetical protein